MQATVQRWHEGSGSVVLDDGRVLDCGSRALDGSGLRLVRPGQRVSIELDGDAVRRMWIPGIELTARD
ncbi:MAG: hypothetical protein V9G08_11890 [Dermatophilaceae bacterium]